MLRQPKVHDLPPVKPAAVGTTYRRLTWDVRDLSLGSPKAEPGSNPRVLGPEHGAATRSRRVNGYPARKPVLRGLRKMN